MKRIKSSENNGRLLEEPLFQAKSSAKQALKGCEEFPAGRIDYMALLGERYKNFRKLAVLTRDFVVKAGVAKPCFSTGFGTERSCKHEPHQDQSKFSKKQTTLHKLPQQTVHHVPVK